MIWIWTVIALAALVAAANTFFRYTLNATHKYLDEKEDALESLLFAYHFGLVDDAETERVLAQWSEDPWYVGVVSWVAERI